MEIVLSPIHSLQALNSMMQYAFSSIWIAEDTNSTRLFEKFEYVMSTFPELTWKTSSVLGKFCCFFRTFLVRRKSSSCSSCWCQMRDANSSAYSCGSCWWWYTCITGIETCFKYADISNMKAIKSFTMTTDRIAIIKWAGFERKINFEFLWRWNINDNCSAI